VRQQLAMTAIGELITDDDKDLAGGGDTTESKYINDVTVAMMLGILLVAVVHEFTHAVIY